MYVVLAAAALIFHYPEVSFYVYSAVLTRAMIVKYGRDKSMFVYGSSQYWAMVCVGRVPVQVRLQHVHEVAHRHVLVGDERLGGRVEDAVSTLPLKTRIVANVV